MKVKMRHLRLRHWTIRSDYLDWQMPGCNRPDPRLKLCSVFRLRNEELLDLRTLKRRCK